MKNVNMYRYRDIDMMPDIPNLSVPDYTKLNRAFREALLDPANNAFRYDENGHPNFGAYLESESNELVTWGILAIGEWLCGLDTDWIAPTYGDFFDTSVELYLNSPNHMRVEYWYLFYVNTLAGAVMRTLYKDNPTAIERMGMSADAMHRLAEKIGHDFNDQGYDFSKNEIFTVKDIYRQPDSIAGYAYNMLFAALNADKPQYMDESFKAIQRYNAFDNNPWYEIPNGSAGLMAAAWLNAHGQQTDVKKAAGWIFDHQEGPLQIGKWGEEDINGLMMGWRGDDRQFALDAAYSMESLMPVQFLLPSVRYCPALAESVAKFMLNVLSSFQLFYAKGKNALYETKAELNPYVPYEKLERVRDGHTPAACGDFWGHRSVYGAGYLYWIEALARQTSVENVFAYDLSLTDWLSKKTYPVFMLSNPHNHAVTAEFSLAQIWERLAPELYKNGLSCDIWEMPENQKLTNPAAISGNNISISLEPHQIRMIALLPSGTTTECKGKLIMAGDVEICAIAE